ncbi:MAG TPA: cytochrome c3 family protein, partial [Gemmatimonadales bacterium]|nr:cytochrome c3 family protein [Gemmatimonadales bacterium]
MTGRGATGREVRGLILAGVLVSGSGLPAQTPRLVAGFDHPKHERLFPTCGSCHRGAEDPEAPMWPDPERCAACHDGVVRARISWRPPVGPRPSNLKFAHELLPLMTRETPG